MKFLRLDLDFNPHMKPDTAFVKVLDIDLAHRVHMYYWNNVDRLTFTVKLQYFSTLIGSIHHKTHRKSSI